MTYVARLLLHVTSIRLALKSRRYRGSIYHCPVCTFDASAFLPSPDGLRQNVRCPRCDSLERHRAQWLFGLNSLPYTGDSRFTLLHVTPEFCTTNRLLRLYPHMNYVTSMFPKHPLADYAFDLQQIFLPDQSVDVVICNHVLEHVPDDRLALAELYRVLSPGGYAFLQVPLDASTMLTDEDAAVVAPEERRIRFGQEDHVRQYGMDYAGRLAEAGFSVELKKFWETHAIEECRRYAVTDREPVVVCRR